MALTRQGARSLSLRRSSWISSAVMGRLPCVLGWTLGGVKTRYLSSSRPPERPCTQPGRSCRSSTLSVAKAWGGRPSGLTGLNMPPASGWATCSAGLVPAPGRCATGRTRAPPFAPPWFCPVWSCPCGLRTCLGLLFSLRLFTEGQIMGLDRGVVYDSPSERFSGVPGLDMGV